jgi:two-component system nitrate/nitrite sensor histidine kinase NarX
MLIEANGAALESVTPEQAARYNVLEDEHLQAAGVMGDIRRAFTGEPIRLAPLYYDPAHIPGAPPGRARWTRGFLTPVLDETGAVCEVLAMVEDITERVQAYQLLEQRVDERTHELASLLDVARTVASTLELGPLLGLILDHLKAVVDYSGAAIQGLEGDVLTVLDYRGPLPRERSVGLRVALPSSGLEEQVIRGGTPVIVDDLHGTDGVGRETTMARAYQDPAPGAPPPDHVRSWLGVPLLLKGRAVGMLTLVYGEPGYYTAHHATLALAMAQQAAVAMENARLYQQAQTLAAQEERQRLARELHDAVTQTLFSASVIAEVLPRLWERDPEAGRQRLEDVRLLTQGALAEMRTLLLELRPAALIEVKLDDLLRQLVAALAGRKRLPITLTVEGDRALPPEVQVALYRVAQEALNNVARHSCATAADVCLRSHARGVVLQIGDDGRGFSVAAVGADHFGLRIMRERVAAIGATLTVRSRPGAGTRVRVVWHERRMENGP